MADEDMRAVGSRLIHESCRGLVREVEGILDWRIDDRAMSEWSANGSLCRQTLP